MEENTKTKNETEDPQRLTLTFPSEHFDLPFALLSIPKEGSDGEAAKRGIRLNTRGPHRCGS